MGLRGRGKRGKDRSSSGWFKDVITNLYTSDQIAKDWEEVTPADRLKLLASWVPKEMKIESDTTISLIINGIKQVKAIDNTPIHALTQGVEDDDTE